MTRPRTHEEIAEALWTTLELCGSREQEIKAILAALREAAAGEREAQAGFWDKLEGPLAMALERGGPNGTVSVSDLLTAVRALRQDARSRFDEPKQNKTSCCSGDSECIHA